MSAARAFHSWTTCTRSPLEVPDDQSQHPRGAPDGKNAADSTSHLFIRGGVRRQLSAARPRTRGQSPSRFGQRRRHGHSPVSACGRSKGFFSVNGSDILGANDVSFGLVMDYGHNIMRLEPGHGPAALITHSFQGTFNFNYGIANKATIGVTLPVNLRGATRSPALVRTTPSTTSTRSTTRRSASSPCTANTAPSAVSSGASGWRCWARWASLPRLPRRKTWGPTVSFSGPSS